jgi:hypothetical protein
MARPDLNRVPTFFHKYISTVPQDEILPAIRELGSNFIVKEVLQHIIDAERIFAYRALCIARKETQSLPGFDENTYADNSKANSRKWNDLVEEFILLRKASEYLFASFDQEQLENNGISNQAPVYVLGLGFVLAGHCQHHLNIIKERYL